MNKIEIKAHGHRSYQPANQLVENNSNTPNYLPWILGGIGGLGLIGIVIYYFTKKKGEQE